VEPEGRRWTLDHLVAAVEVGCGLVVLGWGTVLAVDVAGVPGSTPLDRAFPVLLALVGLVLVGTALRRWRSASRRSRSHGPPGPRSAATRPPAPAPRLSAGGQQELARVVAVLADAGVFVPRAPDPRDLAEAAADHGGPVSAFSTLAALHEAGWYHPGFGAADHAANLAFHDSHVEQLPATLHEQAADLVRLAGGGLDDVRVRVEGMTAEHGVVTVRLRIAAAGGSRTLTYPGSPKYLSTVLHAELARLLRSRGTGRRLAWLWSDQGVWITGLPDGAVDDLNAALGPAAEDGWEWVDEQAPVAAGAPAGP
jgi:hypothetical protein